MYAVLITSEKSYYSISCTLSIESAHSVCLCIDAVQGPMLWQSKMSSLHPKSKSRSVLRRSGKNSAAKLWRLRPKGQIQQPLRSRKRPTIKHGMKHNETVDILSKKITDFMQNILKQDDGSIMWITMKQVPFSDSKSQPIGLQEHAFLLVFFATPPKGQESLLWWSQPKNPTPRWSTGCMGRSSRTLRSVNAVASLLFFHDVGVNDGVWAS